MEELGIKELMPAYRDPNLQTEDLKTGVSFASGACGYDPQTASIVVSISSFFIFTFYSYVRSKKYSHNILQIQQNIIFDKFKGPKLMNTPSVHCYLSCYAF